MLFGVGTSVELLHEKLSREIIRSLNGSAFDVQHVDVDDVFRACQSEEMALWIGPGLSKIMLQRQKDYIQSHSTFVNSVKVTMTALSVVSFLVTKSSSTPT